MGVTRFFCSMGSELLLNVFYSFRVQDPPRCEMLGMDQSQALGRVSELLERPSSPLGKPQSTLSPLGQVTSDPEMVGTVAVPRV